jgi:hypothetical protein
MSDQRRFRDFPQTRPIEVPIRSGGGATMNTYLRRLAVLVLPLVMLVTQPAMAGSVLTAKSLACGGSGPQSGSITVTEKNAVLTLKFKGEDLVPGQAVSCGYTCGMVFTNGPEVSCGTVGANGKLSSKVELPLAVCFGFIPFFNTPSTGKCVPSTVP